MPLTAQNLSKNRVKRWVSIAKLMGFSVLFQNQVQAPAANDMIARRAEMFQHELVGEALGFQSCRQFRHAGEIALLVDGFGNFADMSGCVGEPRRGSAEGIAEEFAEQITLGRAL